MVITFLQSSRPLQRNKNGASRRSAMLNMTIVAHLVRLRWKCFVGVSIVVEGTPKTLDGLFAGKSQNG